MSSTQDADITREDFPNGGWWNSEFELIASNQYFYLGSFGELGWHYDYAFPSRGPGVYTIHFEAPSGLSTEEAVIARFSTTSPLGAALSLSDYRVQTGTPVVLSGLLFEGSPITEATVSAWVTREGDPTTTTPILMLFDNGLEAQRDFATSDGIYSNVFDPVPSAQSGVYNVVVAFEGNRPAPSGNAFFRRTTKRFEVYAPQAEFSSPHVLGATRHDDNQNSLYERLSVSANIDVTVSGFYTLRGVLGSPLGKTATSTVKVDLDPGTAQTVSVDFPSSKFLEWNESGPYTVRSLKLFYEGTTGDDTPSLTDILDGDPATTSAYALSEFEGAPIKLTGVIQESTFDAPPTDGDIDELRINVEAVILVPGLYEFSAQLFGQCPSSGPLIAVASSSGTLVDHPGGTSPVMIPLVFTGPDIKADGVAGPYQVKNLIITGLRSLKSLVSLSVATTQNYSVSSFDGSVTNCNGGDPDACEIAVFPNADCDFNGVLDSCTPALTGACCDATSGTCTTGVAPCNCDGRMLLDATDCNQFDPPCSIACCKSGGICGSENSIAECTSAGGVPIEGGSCPGTQCFAACFGANNCCFGEQAFGSGVVGCNDPVICSSVCAADNTCCQAGQAWDAACVSLAVNLFGTPSNCNANMDPSFPANPYYDACELQVTPSLDCQPNGILDSCEIASRTVEDCDENGEPDSCTPPATGACCDESTVTCTTGVSVCDCNGRFVAGLQSCNSMNPPCTAACCVPSLSGTTCSDQNAGTCAGRPTPGARCSDPGFSCPSCTVYAGCCNESHDSPCCFDALCSQAVCQVDPYCCTVKWDALCASRTIGLPCPSTCVPNAPLSAPGENGYRKNRYISFVPNSGNLSLAAFRVDKLTAPTGSCWVGAPDAVHHNSGCCDEPLFRAWTETEIHVGDCEIMPVADYQVLTTYDGSIFSSALAVPTILLPSLNNKFWGDVAGVNNGSEWTAPNRFTNVQDVVAVLAYIQGAAIKPTLQRANLEAVSAADPCLNAFVNTADVLIVVQASAGAPYPFTNDPATCPLCFCPAFFDGGSAPDDGGGDSFGRMSHP